MRQAITTKFFGPTSARGARVKATCQARSMWYGWQHERSMEENHRRAAEQLARHMGWRGEWFGGFDHHENGVWAQADVGPNSSFMVREPV